jgi:hypothetical protein
MNLPYVSSEGGPILLGDFEVLRGWRGAFDSSDHYDTACQLLGRNNPSQLVFTGAESVVWDFGGPGTGFIVLGSESHISIVRIWPDESWTDDQTESVIIDSATAHYGTTIMAHVTIASGYLLALWAVEDASEFSPPEGDQGVPDCQSIGDGAVYMRVPSGRYEVTSCEWETVEFAVTKLDLRWTDRPV